MGQTILGAQKGDHLVVWVDGHAVPALIPLGGGLLELPGIAKGIEIVFAHGGGVDEGLADMGRRRNIRRPDAKVNDAASSGLLLPSHLGELGKDPRSKAVHALGKFHDITSSRLKFTVPLFCGGQSAV